MCLAVLRLRRSFYNMTCELRGEGSSEEKETIFTLARPWQEKKVPVNVEEVCVMPKYYDSNKVCAVA